MAVAGEALPTKCRWCGETHGVRCPIVKAYEIDAHGFVTRVEFLTPADYPTNKVPQQPSDVPGEDYPRLGPERNKTDAEV